VSVSPAVAELRDARTIRERCQRVLAAGLRGELEHFAVALERLPEAARFTAEITRARYPELRIPAHSRFAHFDAGGVARLARLGAEIAHLDQRERARILTDVVIASVLLDAGAGMAWRFHEPGLAAPLARSEGLAVASLEWIRRGGLSSEGRAYHVDARGLAQVDEGSLRAAFQVTADNPLVGVDGRVALLRALGTALERRSDLFAGARLGGLIDHLIAISRDGGLAATAVLAALLDGLSEIWPGRLRIDGVALGDVWAHPAAGGTGAAAGLVPFHKLSQWLSYSLLHPLAVAGLNVRALDSLTGLAEYRNGGLFIDLGVLVARDAALLERAHEVSSPVVVEWRALTVALLDRIAELVRAELGLTAEQLPLAAVLEGGTWAAGREIARTRRADGGPPLRAISDGTVF
jgi:hypothetical protein